MSTVPHTPLPPGAKAMYDRLMSQLDDVEAITRESLISTQATIARYERLHRMTSVDMRRNLDAGEIEETYEICQWLIELDTLAAILADLR